MNLITSPSPCHRRCSTILVMISVAVIAATAKCEASTSRARHLERKKRNKIQYQTRSYYNSSTTTSTAADTSIGCVTLLDFRYDCYNDLLVDYDHDSRILTVRDYTYYVNKLAHQQPSSSSSSSSIQTSSSVYYNQSLSGKTFPQINEMLQMVYIDHLCKVYLSRGILPQFRENRIRNIRQPSSNSPGGYTSLQECYIDLLQHSTNSTNSSFGYPSDQDAIEDVNELCQDLFHPAISLGYLNSCDGDCITRKSFIPVCTEELLGYAGNQSVTGTDYTQFVKVLQSMSSPSSSDSTTSALEFQDLEEPLKKNFIRHICQYQQGTNTTSDDCEATAAAGNREYPSYSASAEDMTSLCSDLFRLVSCLNNITPCDGEIDLVEDCVANATDVVLQSYNNENLPFGSSPYDIPVDKAENIDGLAPIIRTSIPSPLPATEDNPMIPSPTPVSSQNAVVAFVSEPLGIVVCAASSVAIIAIIVGIFVAVVRKEQRKRIQHSPEVDAGSASSSSKREETSGVKAAARIRVDHGVNYHGLSDDLISEAGAQSLTNAETEALTRSKKAHKSNI